MESIHPNDIITLDLNSISYLTLKNGNMVLIDDSVPEKGIKDNPNIPKSSIFSKNDIKIAPKKFKLKIEYPSKFYIKGIKVNNINYKYNNKYDYKKSNKIIKNESFTFRGIKLNNNYNFNIYDKDKENIQMNNNFIIEKNHKVHFKDENNINNIYNPTQSSKENEIPQIKNMSYNNININQNNNYNNVNIDNNNIYSYNSDYNQSKINTNMSIPISSINNNNENKNNLNNNNNNMNPASKRKNKSKIFGFFGKDKKVRISINAVCSLNIKAEDKYKINLINQFNNLVDRLNGEREKATVNKLLENEKNEKFSKFYPLYKNKVHNDIIKKNFNLMNQNYDKDFNSEINNNNIIGNKTLNNFYKKDNLGYNKQNANLMVNPNSNRRLSSQSSNEIEKLRNKIQRLSTGIVRPSNKMFNI